MKNRGLYLAPHIPGGVSVRIYINLFIIKKSATSRIEPRTMGTFSVIKPTAPQQHILGCKLVATYHPFPRCQIREQLAQIVPNGSSFQPPLLVTLLPPCLPLPPLQTPTTTTTTMIMTTIMKNSNGGGTQHTTPPPNC